MRLFFQLKHIGQMLCIAILGCSSILGMLLMWEYRENAIGASASAHDLLQFIEVVRAMNTISAERGPTNAMVAAHGDRPELAVSLDAIRRKSDAGLARIGEDPSLAGPVGAIRDESF